MAKMCVFLFMCVLSLTVCKKLKRLEDRMNLVETRQDIESMTRREEFATIMERLDIIEMLFNKSDEARPHIDYSLESHDEKPTNTFDRITNRNVDVILKAFNDEKKMTSRLRRHVSTFTSSMEEMKTTLTDTSQSILRFLEKVSTKEYNDTVSNQLYNNVQDMCSNAMEYKNFTSVSIENLINQNQLAHEKVVERIDDLDDKVNKMIKSININMSQTLNKVVDAVEKSQFPGSCSDILSHGETKSGVYTVYPKSLYSPVRVYCDMVTEGGGWTVFQRRQDGSQDFNQDWKTYQEGFGDLNGEFWLGNELLSIMTNVCCYELRIELADFEGNTAMVKYGAFKVYPEDTHYALFVDKYLPAESNETVGDALSHHSDKQFSARDKDLDDSEGHCGKVFRSGWWFRKCYHTNLNGEYRQDKSKLTKDKLGLSWNTWNDLFYLLKMSEMKFRKTGI